MILVNILESEDSYSIVSKVRNAFSSYQLCFAYLILFVFVQLFIHLS